MSVYLKGLDFPVFSQAEAAFPGDCPIGFAWPPMALFCVLSAPVEAVWDAVFRGWVSSVRPAFQSRSGGPCGASLPGAQATSLPPPNNPRRNVADAGSPPGHQPVVRMPEAMPITVIRSSCRNAADRAGGNAGSRRRRNNSTWMRLSGST